MKRKSTTKEMDDLLPDYDLSKMRLVKRGPGYAKRAQGTDEQLVRVTLDPDVASIFADERSVNEALRTMIRVLEAVKA